MAQTVQRKKINLNALSNRSNKRISTEEALKEIIPFEWSDEVASGNKKITVYDIVEENV